MSPLSFCRQLFASSSRRRRRYASVVTAGLESLESRRVLSANGWYPGTDNFESEDNDTQGRANEIAFTSAVSREADEVYTGAIRTTDDVDFYSFELYARADVQVDLYKLHPDLYQLDGDLDIELRDADGSVVDVSVRGGGNPERMINDLAAGEYFLRVYPWDVTGFGASYQLRIQAETTQPGDSTVTGPGDTDDTTPTITWTDATDATHYDVYVHNYTSGSREFWTRNVQDTDYTHVDSLGEGRYGAWVRPWNGDSVGEWSAMHRFRIDSLQTPEVTGPADTHDSTPTFTWTGSSSASHYELWVTNRTTGERVVYEDGVTTTNFTPAQALQSGDHTVWVRAWDGSTRTDWSQPHRFTLESSRPGTPDVLGPVDTHDTTPKFSWTTADHATHYELWVHNRDIGRRVIYREEVTATDYTPTDEMATGRHAVWVRAWNGEIPGDWTAAHRFELGGDTVGQSQVTGPADTTDATPEFTWTAADNATDYELWVQNRTAGRRAIHRTGLQTTSFTPETDLTDGDYTVWVRASNSADRGTWSAAHNFTLTLSEDPDPNGTNNTRGNAVYLPNRETSDLLTDEDTTDYYYVANSNRYFRMQFTWTITVTEGNVDDLAVSLEDGYGSKFEGFSFEKDGNTLIVSSGGYWDLRYRGYKVNLRLDLTPGGSTVRYDLESEVRQTDKNGRS